MDIQRPIILIGTHRSGTTWLAQALSKNSKLALWMEPKYVWSWGNNFKPDDRLTERDATPEIVKHIQKRFKKFVDRSGKDRLLEKTPSNCLRLPFIRTVFPEAKIIHIIRDGRSVFYSTSRLIDREYYRRDVLQRRFLEMLIETPYWAWLAYVPKIVETLACRLEGRSLSFWGPRPPGWHEWIDKYPKNVVLAKQWSATVSQAVQDGNAINDRNCYFRLYYEDLIQDPVTTMLHIVEFAELQNADNVIEYVKRTIDPERQTKWHELLSRETLQQIRPYMEGMLEQLGYSW